MRKGNYPDWLPALQKRPAVPDLMNAARIAKHHVHKGGYAPLTPGGHTCHMNTIKVFLSVIAVIISGFVVAVCYRSHTFASELVVQLLPHACTWFP